MPSRLLVTAATAGALLFGALVPAVQAADAPVTYSYPAGVTGPEFGLTTDPAGNVYFSVSDAFSPSPRIGKFVLSEAAAGAPAFKFFTTPTSLSNLAILRSLDYDDEKGQVWFSRSDGMYGFGAASQLVDGAASGFQFARTPSGVNVQNVAVDPVTHQVWLTEHGARNVTDPGQSTGYFAGNRIAVTSEGLGLSEGPNIAQQGGQQTLVSARYDAKPYGIVPDGAGGAWFTQANPGLPGYRVAHSSGVTSYTEYCINNSSPCTAATTGTGPTAITRAKDGVLWFTNELNSNGVLSSIGRLDAAGGTFTSFALSGMDPAFGGGRPMSIEAASDGSIWFATRGGSAAANAVVRLQPSADGTAVTPTVYKTTSPPISLSISATGDVWASLSTGLFRIGNAAPATGTTTPPPTDPTQGTTPPPGATQPPTLKGVVGKATVSPPNGPEVALRQICVGPPQDKCSLVYLLDSREYVTGFPGTKSQVSFGAAPKKKPKKPKTVELGRQTAVIDGGQTANVTVQLSKKAQALLKTRKKLKVTLRTMQVVDSRGTLKKVSSKELTFRYKKPAKKTK